MRVEEKSSTTFHRQDDKVENGGGTSSILVIDDDFESPMHTSELVNAKKEAKGKDKLHKGKIKGVLQEMPSITTRSSPKSLHEGINGLSEVQRASVKQMGFERMLSLTIDGIPGMLGHYVVDRLDTKRMCIDIENASIKITKEAIHTLIGVPIGGLMLVKNSDPKENKNVSKVWKNVYGKSDISPSDIVRRLKTYTQADWLFRVDFVMLFLTIMIDCQKNGNCKLSYLPFFPKGRDISTVDWCSMIYSAIRNCKVDWVRDDPKSVFNGPLTILLVSIASINYYIKHMHMIYKNLCYLTCSYYILILQHAMEYNFKEGIPQWPNGTWRE
ncbi:hypothetical protein HanRHA438_Chr05g0222121 [Helianthus annuus]|uniref:Ulp1 protease family, C-terminal catalytic domain-containing protein n=1 Tax=Helianthus annuus TaxID=4232 RepID=A0A9K3NMI0_HELAN|nr:hypothetical protein HanXRQr2_Chr05g0212701 [Helianthus annuus]KAJ0576834.1 hypothetical protein HanIR_Chr05g0228981 [Helianthus annuus]KAJ0747055.1 hypothetical protein HanOQP8_Chr05g0185061 [Helianthus annuus]KAJ0918795.1 hypothetical protein HanRHA438_Chr05g0222121 [Helianthus annuus]KAJ0922599.1 hypothetical protein HanPSC8_Chr05g0205771 [Helianthus annuus]